MPHRLVSLTILVFWAVAAAALFVRDVLPDLIVGPPPDLRDVAHAEGKKVRLEVSGGETTLDKAVLDRLGEPLLHLVSNAVAHGLAWDAALAAITSSPAAIFGIGKDRGRIENGMVADLVLWSGDPLEVTTVAEQAWIAGQPVAMRSRQTELRDRYLERARSGGAR